VLFLDPNDLRLRRSRNTTAFMRRDHSFQPPSAPQLLAKASGLSPELRLPSGPQDAPVLSTTLPLPQPAPSSNHAPQTTGSSRVTPSAEAEVHTPKLAAQPSPASTPKPEPKEELSFFVDVSGNPAPAGPQSQEPPHSDSAHPGSPPQTKRKVDKPVPPPTPPSIPTDPEAAAVPVRRSRKALKAEMAKEDSGDAEKRKDGLQQLTDATEGSVPDTEPPKATVQEEPMQGQHQARLTALRAEMGRLAAVANYEAARRIRDEIHKLEAAGPPTPAATFSSAAEAASATEQQRPTTEAAEAVERNARIDTLKAEMKRCVAAFQYEVAGRIRDEILKLEATGPRTAAAAPSSEGAPGDEAARATKAKRQAAEAAKAAASVEAAEAAEAARQAEAATEAAAAEEAAQAAEAERQAKVTALKLEMGRQAAASQYEVARQIRDEIRKLEATGPMTAAAAPSSEGIAGDQAAQATKAGEGPKAAVEGPKAAVEGPKAAVEGPKAAKAAAEAEAKRQMRLAALRAEAARLEALQHVQGAMWVRNQILKLEAVGSAAGQIPGLEASGSAKGVADTKKSAKKGKRKRV